MHKPTTYTTNNFISNHNQTIPFNTNPLVKNAFLINLTKLFHVSSIPLAIFILITICILCLTLLIVIILCIRTCVHRKYIPKSYKKKDKPVYVDDIPGLGKSNDASLHNYEIFHYNETYIDQCLGKLEIPLKQIDHSEYAGNYLERIDWLSMHQLNIIDIGELCIGLGYFPQKSSIDICIFEGKNLLLNNYLQDDNQWKWLKLSSIIELDWIIYVKYKQRYLHKCKTQTRKELINPYFNEKFNFTIKQKYLKTLTIILQLRQIEKWKYKRIIGEIQIGFNVTQWKGTKHWEEILNTPNKLHVRWHTILPIPMKTIPYFIDWPCFDEFW
ncbi:Synaptotagmin-11 [Schistosoma japonicum]|uniref:Synaptotagmin-11 n=1 Tax=Schistosoma japonicum TaxID=6182 RepID=A0A4Z2D717_SCHJA|nr:Synaptotagmin-11 [Schistosoma japonicum]